MNKSQDYYTAYLAGYDACALLQTPFDCPYEDEQEVNIEGWFDGYNDAIEKEEVKHV